MLDTLNKIHVTYFFRKPQAQYFSIEKVFEQVIRHLPDDIDKTEYRLKTGTNGWWGRLKALLEVRRNKGIINHITGDITFIALALPRKGLVVTYHDLESLTQYQGWRFRLLKYLWVTLPVRRAQVVTAISNHTREQLVKWTGCNPDKIVVVANPLPEELSYSPREFNTECPTILVMGTKSNKNVEGVLEAVGRLKSSGLKDKGERLKEDRRLKVEGERLKDSGLKDKGERLKEDGRLTVKGDRLKDSGLTVEGERLKDLGLKVEGERLKKDGSFIPSTKNYKLIVVGKMTQQHHQLAEKYELDIENLVQITYEQILDAYRRCDMLCFPSFYEGFGLPIIEAQAIGRPVITSDFGAMKEVSGEGARLVDPYDIDQIGLAIRDIIDSEELRSSLVMKGQENIKRFGAEEIAMQYAEVYGRLAH